MIIILTVGGCSLTGSWKRVSVEPPGSYFPIEFITFDKQNQYTATWKDKGRSRTSVGIYQGQRFSLDVAKQDEPPRTYRIQKRLDGRLILIYETDGVKVSALLERDDS